VPPSYSAGIVHHDSFDELERCLASLRRQTHPPRILRVLDHGLDRDRIHGISSRFPEVHFRTTPNRGYAGGANELLRRAQRDASAFALILNPDTELDADFAERLLGAFAQPRVAIASGKLLRRGRDRIDSAGIRLPAHGRPRDRGSGKRDRGQYETSEPVFAVSGAAMMLRVSILKELAVDGEIFDEDFFLYHEDTDLCWRAHRLGYLAWYEASAVAVHNRRWQKRERFDIEPTVRRHSFKNHYLQLIRNESLGGFLVRLPVLASWEALRLGYALLRDRAVLGAYGDALRLAPRMWRKRRTIAARVSAGVGKCSQRGETDRA